MHEEKIVERTISQKRSMVQPQGINPDTLKGLAPLRTKTRSHIIGHKT